MAKMGFFKDIFNSLLILSVINRLGWSYMVKNDTDAMMYFQRFGYMEPEDMSPGMGMDEAKPMLMAFQKMCNINQTGMLDSKTMEMMNAPRCGNKDMIRVPASDDDISSNRVKRYTINDYNAKWRKREVTYKMGQYSTKIHHNQTAKDKVLETIQKAFNLWSEACNLDFTHKPHEQKVDIFLSFALPRDHNRLDEFPFDGPGKVLAHAFPPGESPLSGDVHFDDEETWQVDSPKGTDILFVAVHEIGHALGLSHSSTKGAIMSAFYPGYKPHLRLHPDDVEGIQKLYGKREIPLRSVPAKVPQYVPPPPPSPPFIPRLQTTPRPVPTRHPQITHRPHIQTVSTTSDFSPKDFTPKLPWGHGHTSLYHDRLNAIQKGKSKGGLRPNLCSDTKIDAITTLADGKIYAFRGSYVFELDSQGKGILPNSPNHIGAIFKGLDINIDAAATRKNGKTYFFKGSKYWRFSGTTMDPNYPKTISRHFIGIPDNVDAAFIWLDGFYFIKGEKFWRFNPKTKPHIDLHYPLSISVWGLNIPYVDAAFQAPNGEIYFFKDSEYYRLDQRTFKIANTEPPYPRSTRLMWLGCTDYRPDARNIREPYNLVEDNEEGYREIYDEDDY